MKRKKKNDGITNQMELQLWVPREHFLTDEQANQEIMDLITEENSDDYRQKQCHILLPGYPEVLPSYPKGVFRG